MNADIIRERIHEVRGQRVMLDFDLAELYGVETRTLNQAVKRNINRFPEDFMFRLTEEEWRNWSQIVMSSGDMRSQIVTGSDDESEKDSELVDNKADRNSSQIVMSSEGKKNRGKVYFPYAFTEHGVTMLASVLRREKAVNMSIAVVRAFIALKEYAVRQHTLTDQLQEIRDRLGEHDVQLNSIYSAIENLLDNRAKRRLRTRRSEERRSAEVPGRTEELERQRADRF